MTKIHTATKDLSPSTAWQSIMLKNEDGACIAMLAIMNTDDPLRVADQVVAAINAKESREGDQS